MKMMKYPKMNNTYSNKTIDFFRETIPEIDTIKYVITEKIHGANFQVMIEDGKITCATRNRILENDATFHGFQDVVIPLIAKSLIRNYFDKPVRLFGEFFGKSIQKGVKYFDEKSIQFFDMTIENNFVSFDNFMITMDQCNLPTVPVINASISLQDAINFDVENFKSVINEDIEGENIAEGIVIKPVRELWVGHDRFVLKKKSDNFAEKVKRKKPIIEKQVNEVLVKWKNVVAEYVTSNRMDNLFSKIGVIGSEKEIGKYMAEYMKDVKEDVTIDHPELSEEIQLQKDVKYVFNFSKEVLKMLKVNL